MRLVNTATISLEEFPDNDVPSYAILSHTWGEDEVNFRSFQAKAKTNGTGWAKITNSCNWAKQQGLGYIWIDTCCINKSSSAELQEAINSMFRYYQEATACYALLSDVRDATSLDQFRNSRWFKRGWTLQELVAPKDVTFFANKPTSRIRMLHGTKGQGKGWIEIGRRGSELSAQMRDYDAGILARTISEITRIDIEFLTGLRPLSQASVAARMAWAAGRKTTRKEDRAYSLLGIFDINMTMLYGEGDKAFIRLQREIMGVSDDETILCWHYGLSFGQCVHDGLFATSPDCYEACAELVPVPPSIVDRRHYIITNKGLRIKGSMQRGIRDGTLLMGLNCATRSDMARLRAADDTVTEFRSLMLCLTTDVASNLFNVWRHSNSRPFKADPNAFQYDPPSSVSASEDDSARNSHLTLSTQTSKRKDSDSDLPRRRRQNYEQGMSLYIRMVPPPLSSLPFFMVVESTMLQSLQNDTGFELIDVEPGFAAQVVDRIDKQHWDRWKVDVAHVKDIDMNILLHYQHKTSLRKYATKLAIAITKNDILSAKKDYLHRASDICETSLDPPHVLTRAYEYNEAVTNHQVRSTRAKYCVHEENSGVWFQIKVLTYMQSMTFTLGYTDKQPEGDMRRPSEDSESGCVVS